MDFFLVAFGYILTNVCIKRNGQTLTIFMGLSYLALTERELYFKNYYPMSQQTQFDTSTSRSLTGMVEKSAATSFRSVRDQRTAPRSV